MEIQIMEIMEFQGCHLYYDVMMVIIMWEKLISDGTYVCKCCGVSIA